MLEGYAYNIDSPPPRVAIGILMAYCILAVAHVCYQVVTGKPTYRSSQNGVLIRAPGMSSTCWDSIAEVTALTVNSSPSALHRNTCAGITELHIFKLPVQILGMADEEGEGEHLELIFGDVNKEKTKKNTIKPNRTYGTMLSMKEKIKTR